jgi:3D-(3,5/4)-trihydroxycyclohexane-1,2-dione acylhydrolase (decyclizing)
MTTTLPATEERSAVKTLRLTAGQASVRFLQAQYSERDGVRRRVIPAVYGIFGHGNVGGIGQGLEEVGDALTYYQGKNEQAMVHAAIGYAKSHDLLSTFAVTTSIGPGATNLVTGAATATVNRIPVLLLPGDVFATRLQGPVLQQLEHPSEADVSANDCLRSVSRFFDRVTRPEQLLTTMPRAIEALLEPGAQGAVTVAVCQDVQGEVYDYPESFFEERVHTVARRPPADEEIRSAVELIAQAERPLIVAGGGVRYAAAQAELADLADALGVPIAETLAGKGVAAGHPRNVGGLGFLGSAAANTLAAESDLIIAVGTRLADAVTCSNSAFQHPSVRFIGVNTVGSDARKLGAVAVVADAKLALIALREALQQTPARIDATYGDDARARTSAWFDQVSATVGNGAGQTLSGPEVVEVLHRVSRSEDSIVFASSTSIGYANQMWRDPAAGRLDLEYGFSCMGHEIPAALGIAMAKTDPGEVYAVVGDGTWLMGNTTELVTAVQENLKVTVILSVNGGFQCIRGFQIRATGVDFGNEFRVRDATNRLAGELVSVDYLKSAEALGCATFAAATPVELEDALAAAREERRPCVIQATIDERDLDVDNHSWWDVCVPHASTRPATQKAAHDYIAGADAQRYHH